MVDRLAFLFVLTRVLNVLFDYSQVSKKKKKKSKTDGNDSGVEVYFREEDDDDEDKKPQANSVKFHFFFSVSDSISFSRLWKIEFICLSRWHTAVQGHLGCR